jgi:hypothetical protein
MILIAAMIASAQPALPPPDPPNLPTSTEHLALTSATVCAGSCLANGAGLLLSLNANSAALIAAGPVLGLAGGAVGGALAEGVTPDPDPEESQIGWGALCSAGGYLLFGGAAAAIGYAWGAATSDDAPLLAGGFAALGLGAAGGAIGAGAGTLFALTIDPPEL